MIFRPTATRNWDLQNVTCFQIRSSQRCLGKPRNRCQVHIIYQCISWLLKIPLSAKSSESLQHNLQREPFPGKNNNVNTNEAQTMETIKHTPHQTLLSITEYFIPIIAPTKIVLYTGIATNQHMTLSKCRKIYSNIHLRPTGAKKVRLLLYRLN